MCSCHCMPASKFSIMGMCRFLSTLVIMIYAVPMVAMDIDFPGWRILLVGDVLLMDIVLQRCLEFPYVRG